MPPFRVPPIPGLTERLDHEDGPMGAVVHTTAMRMIEQAISLLRKAATLDPKVRGKVADALASFGASIPDDDGEDERGEPMRPSGLQTPSRNF